MSLAVNMEVRPSKLHRGPSPYRGAQPYIHRLPCTGLTSFTAAAASLTVGISEL